MSSFKASGTQFGAAVRSNPKLVNDYANALNTLQTELTAIANSGVDVDELQVQVDRARRAGDIRDPDILSEDVGVTARNVANFFEQNISEMEARRELSVGARALLALVRKNKTAAELNDALVKVERTMAEIRQSLAAGVDPLQISVAMQTLISQTNIAAQTEREILRALKKAAKALDKVATNDGNPKAPPLFANAQSRFIFE